MKAAVAEAVNVCAHLFPDEIFFDVAQCGVRASLSATAAVSNDTHTKLKALAFFRRENLNSFGFPS